MKTITEVTADKIRGGFYSPPGLVAECLCRLRDLLGSRQALRILEPGAGDGAFLRGMRQWDRLDRVDSVLAIELIAEEAAHCQQASQDLSCEVKVVNESVVRWASYTNELFDAVIGNPPFVRYQFVSPTDKSAITDLGERLEISFKGVSNLWIPFLLGSLSRLKRGGAFAVIVPTECLTGISAAVVRRWLARNISSLRVDLFPVGSFPSVLQEVLIISGERQQRATNAGAVLQLVEHDRTGRTLEWSHLIDGAEANWTRYLLAPSSLDALREALDLGITRSLGTIARFEVAVVTGANEYFSVDSETVERYDLEKWVRPLLPRIRHAPGLIYSSADHQQSVTSGTRAHLLHFDEQLPNPELYRRPRDYFQLGRVAGIPERYKCRIRDPWYRVPLVWPGRLMLSKRAHEFHRVVLNEADVVTTDTIYRGVMRAGYEKFEAALVASFHNSLTLLSAEIEGRSFGGGVLELVPTEIARLAIPYVPELAQHLGRLDSLARLCSEADRGSSLINETNRLLTRHASRFTDSLMTRLEEARQALLRRRLDRAAGPDAADLESLPA